MSKSLVRRMTLPVGIVIIAVAGMAVLMIPKGQAQPALAGTILAGKPAPNFRLTDQWDHQVTLSQFRGRTVILTFMESHCTTLCPRVAEKIRHTVEGLGKASNRVAVLAVSTDPEGDTLKASRAFSAEHGMLHRWHYLTATRARLERVWHAYYIYAAPPGASATLDSAHTSATYLIDASGRERVLMGGDLDATLLDRDVRLLTGLPLQKSPVDVAPEVGALAPDFTLRTPQGASVRLSSLRGKTVLINFWATWCTACRSEMPRLAAWYRQMKGRGLVVLGVDQQESAASVRAYADKLHIPYPVVLDSAGDISARYNTIFLPTSMLVNREGIVTAIKVGVLDQRFLQRSVQPLL